MDSKKEMPIEHRTENTTVGVEARIPGYQLKFFVSHETVTDTVQPKLNERAEDGQNNQDRQGNRHD